MRHVLASFALIFLVCPTAVADVVSAASSAVTVEFQSASSQAIQVSIDVLPEELLGFSDGVVNHRSEGDALLLAPSNPFNDNGELLELNAALNATTAGNVEPASGDWLKHQSVVLTIENMSSAPVTGILGGSFALKAESWTDEPLPSLGLADAMFDVEQQGNILFQRSVAAFSDAQPDTNTLFGGWSIDLVVAGDSSAIVNITTSSFVSVTSFQAVPEPTTSGLLMVVASVVCIRRERFISKHVP